MMLMFWFLSQITLKLSKCLRYCTAWYWDSDSMNSSNGCSSIPNRLRG